MKNKLILYLVLVSFELVLFPNNIISQESDEFNIVMMHSSFKILGNNGVAGTGFFVAYPLLKDTTKQIVLVTAKHVLDQMTGDSITLFLKERKGETYKIFPHKVQIRINGRNRFVSHPTEDVSAIAFKIPTNVFFGTVSIESFATDTLLRRIDLRPGDELFVLGYPLGFSSSNSGFPILRSGIIASYPILPSDTYKSFLIDFEVFPGNSGGLVYFYQEQRVINDKLESNVYHFLVGLVSQEILVEENITSLTESNVKKHKLSLGKVIHTKYIIETLEILSNLYTSK